MRITILAWLLWAISVGTFAGERIEDVLGLCDVAAGEDGGTDTGTFNARCIVENQDKVTELLARTRSEIDPEQTKYDNFIKSWNQSARKRCASQNAWCTQGAMCGHLDLACKLQADIDLLQRLSCNATSKTAVHQLSTKSRNRLAKYCVSERFGY